MSLFRLEGGIGQAGICCPLLQKAQKKPGLGWSVAGVLFIIKRIFSSRSTSQAVPNFLVVLLCILSVPMSPVF